MSKVFNDVAVFMNAVGQVVEKKPTSESPLSDLYKRLITEEIAEFWEADGINDDTERLDAVFDIIWVLVGYAHARGWDINKAWDEGAKSNLVKIDPETGHVRRRDDGKILKPTGWKEPNFKQFVV
jgi:predicted HAD superfamily Cof-like phosphohydrolase